MDAETLARHIIRNVEYPPDGRSFVHHVAEEILNLRPLIPDDSHLVLGGSLARGEATIVAEQHEYRLESDIDLLLIHESTLPPFTSRKFIDTTVARLPTVTLMTCSLEEYQRLETSIGHEFKDLGIPINAARLPGHSRVTVDARDAYELMLFSICTYFWSSIAERWISGDNSPDFHLETNRITIKLLRSAAMLSGVNNHADTAAMPAGIASAMSAELQWRRDPSREPMDPGRVWPILADTLRRFDDEFGGPRADAVEGTRFADRSGADAVAWHQRMANALARGIIREVADAQFTAARVDAAKSLVWSALVNAGATRPTHTPEELFTNHKEVFREALFTMKISAPGTGPDWLRPSQIPIQFVDVRPATASS